MSMQFHVPLFAVSMTVSLSVSMSVSRTCVWFNKQTVKGHVSGARRSFLTKEALIIGLFCRKWPIKIRHPVTQKLMFPKRKMKFLMKQSFVQCNV